MGHAAKSWINESGWFVEQVVKLGGQQKEKIVTLQELLEAL